MTRARALGLSALSAVLLLGSFDPLRLDWLVWVALVPLLLALRGAGLRRAVACGCLTGFLFHLGQNYWIAVTVWDNREWLPFGNAGALAVALGAWGGTAAVVLTPATAVFAAVSATASRWLPGAAGFWLVAPAWCFGEFLRSLGALGHVWGNLGYALWQRLSLIQSADLGGVYLTAFLVALTNAAVAALVVRGGACGSSDERARTRDCTRPLVLVVAFLHLANWGYGRARLATELQGSDRRVRAVAVQESVPVADKAVAATVWTELKQHENATLSVTDTELVVWPETALPTVVTDLPAMMTRLTDLATRSNRTLVVGAMDRDAASRDYNAALVFAPKRGLIGRYYKRHLVPFGERVPYQRALPFLKVFKAREPEFWPGSGFTPVETDLGKLGICICFESMFPSICRQLVANGAELLVILTNDDWYRDTIAPQEHAAMAAFRAVETRRDVVRAANTGVSCIFDSTGRLLKRTKIGERVTLSATVRLRHSRTLYVRLGDWLPLLSLGVVVATLALGGWKRRLGG
jgi:apolipoprotein N-acyltransferase